MIAEPQRRLWMRDDYHRAGDLGLFGPEERLELFEGEVIEKVSPQRRPHRKGIRCVSSALENSIGPAFVVWTQLPLVLSDFSEPEPDVMVLYGPEDRYAERDPEPSDVALLVEVADITLGFDTNRKSSRYAAAGIPDYWVLDISGLQLQVRRNPQPDSGAPYGHSYSIIMVLRQGDKISPLASPTATLLVDDLLR